MTVDDVLAVLQAEGFDFTQEWKDHYNQLYRAIGERYLAADSGGSGTHTTYTEQHIRRAVAYLRIGAVIGIPRTYKSAKILDDLRDIAMHHEDGVALHDGHEAYWVRSDLEEVIGSLVAEGNGFVAIPCWVESLSTDFFGTVAIETEEE